MQRKGVVGSMLIALPVIVITILVLVLFIFLVSTVLHLKAPDKALTASTFDLNFQSSRALSDLFLHDAVILNEAALSYPEIERFFPQDYLVDFQLGKSFEVSTALSTVLHTWSRAGALANGLPHSDVVALFSPLEKIFVDRYGCNGDNAFKVFAPQPRSGSLGSGSGLFLIYDYPERLWSRGGDGLPKLESFSSSTSIRQVLDTYRSQGYYVNDLGSGYYLLIKGNVPC